MNEVFNEYSYKDATKRLKFRYIRQKDSHLNPWEITNFVSRVSTYMYKIELVNTIAIAINNGIKPENIFILDKAYKLNANYKDFSTLKLDSLDINNIFSVGKPISIKPNKDLIEMSLLFELFFKVNQILYRYGENRISAQDRLDGYKNLLESDFLEAIVLFCNKANMKISEENDINVSDKIKKEREKISKKYQSYIKSKDYIDNLIIKLDEGDIDTLKNNDKEITKKYYNQFFEFLIRLPRPVVGIYHKELNEFQILCCDHFDYNVEFNTRIDLRSITQNSPIMSEIEAGYSISLMHKDDKRKEQIHELEKKKLELELINLEMDSKIKEQEIVKNDLDMINKAIEIKLKIDELADKQENLGIKSMATSYASKQIKSIYGKVQNGYLDVLHTNNFIEDTSAISIIDLKV